MLSMVLSLYIIVNERDLFSFWTVFGTSEDRRFSRVLNISIVCVMVIMYFLSV